MEGDRQNTGSRNSDGNVPNVNWNADNRKLYVNWCNPENRNGNLRTRAEVFSKRAITALFVRI